MIKPAIQIKKVEQKEKKEELEVKDQIIDIDVRNAVDKMVLEVENQEKKGNQDQNEEHKTEIVQGEEGQTEE